jgi:hypothetical protein
MLWEGHEPIFGFMTKKAAEDFALIPHREHDEFGKATCCQVYSKEEIAEGKHRRVDEVRKIFTEISK